MYVPKQLINLNRMNTQKMTRVYEDLHHEEFQRKLSENKSAVLIDVRTSEEFETVRIPDSINIDVMDYSFTERISELDKSKTYFVYCRSGGRSRQACTVMSSHGFAVYNLSGGIGSWTGPVCD